MKLIIPVCELTLAAVTGSCLKSSCFAPTIDVTKSDMTLVTLCATQVRLRCSTNPPQGVGLLDTDLGMAEIVLSHFIVLLKSDLDFQQTVTQMLVGQT